MVQKAVEMGAARLQPVLTRHGQVARVNLERMRANAIEAAEQCGILSIPEIVEPIGLFRKVLAAREASRTIIFSDEDADVADPLAALSAVPRPVRRSRCWLGPKAASPKTSGRLYSNCRTWSALRSARASCAPTRPPSRR